MRPNKEDLSEYSDEEFDNFLDGCKNNGAF